MALNKSRMKRFLLHLCLAAKHSTQGRLAQEHLDQHLLLMEHAKTASRRAALLRHRLDEMLEERTYLKAKKKLTAEDKRELQRLNREIEKNQEKKEPSLVTQMKQQLAKLQASYEVLQKQGGADPIRLKVVKEKIDAYQQKLTSLSASP